MNKQTTELVFILDESGSMWGLTQDTIGGFNSMISKQKSIEGECKVTTVLFNSEHRMLHDRIDIDKVNVMTIKDYQPNGCTALMDTVGDTIKHITMIHKYIKEEDIPNKVLFVIMTDGEENASRRFNKRSIKNLIKGKRKDGWEFVFIGANIEAEEVAKNYGINTDNAVNYHADPTGTNVVYDSLNEVVGNFRLKKKVDKNWKDKIVSDYKSRK